ncbi:MAG: tripartite tricarboxylate transporter permease [Nanoarchaeota archaeon]|nr:tripartite tricarboxylate transporter permease [Nanoarchaeota archaeon]
MIYSKMLIEIILALLLGITAGTFTGIIPGIHINLVAAGLLALLSGAYFTGIAPIVLVVFVVAMAVTHTFIDFIPSIFLGAPEEDSFLAVLPGHQLLREGKGYEAVVMTLYGSLMALPIILIFSFVFIFFLDNVYDIIRVLLPYILIFVSLYLVFREQEWVLAGVVFVMAGFLGLFSFDLPVKNSLLPLLTGLFGTSALIVSLKTRIAIPKQKIKPLRKIKLKFKDSLISVFAAAVSAPLCSFLPGLGAGQAAVIGSELSGNLGRDRRSFLFLVGAINTIVMALSFVTIFAIGRTRTGAAVAVQEILGEITVGGLFVILGTIVVTGFFAFFLGLQLAKVFSARINKINYRKLSIFVLGLLLIINLVLSNWIGLIILFTASALGVFCILSRVRRIQLMGALLLPTIVFYLFG